MLVVSVDVSLVVTVVVVVGDEVKEVVGVVLVVAEVVPVVVVPVVVGLEVTEVDWLAVVVADEVPVEVSVDVGVVVHSSLRYEMLAMFSGFPSLVPMSFKPTHRLAPALEVNW